MKYCPNCNADVEDDFNVCWNCNYSFTDEEILDFEEEDMHKKDLNCLRCNDVKLLYSGNYKFHEGAKLGMFGTLFEAFVNRESFDLYVCPKCGKVEFFVP